MALTRAKFDLSSRLVYHERLHVSIQMGKVSLRIEKEKPSFTKSFCVCKLVSLIILPKKDARFKFRLNSTNAGDVDSVETEGK